MTETGEIAANRMKADTGRPDSVAGVDAAHSEGAGEPRAACPACGALASRALFTASDRLYGLTDKEFRVVECVACRLIRLLPPPTSSELRGYYPADYWFAPQGNTVDRLQEWYRRLVLHDHIRFVRRVVQDSGESGLVLDVGCGGGLFLRMLGEFGFRVIGLDVSRDAASVAWKCNQVLAVCATLSHAPLRPNACAAVTMFHVLEHLSDPRPYLEQARTLLSPNGRLIVQVPNAASWQFRLLGRNWSGIDVPRHALDFRPENLDVLLERCGFAVVRRKHFSLRDNPAGLATSLAPWLDPMARRVRGVQESSPIKLLKNLMYLLLLVACLPFAVLEAAFQAGSTIMVEARKKL